jgi:hypothetical protein
MPAGVALNRCVQSLPRTRVEHGSWDSVCVDRFVYISEHQLIRPRHEVVRIQVLSVHNGVDAPRVDLGQGNRCILVSRVAHTVPAVSCRRMRARLDRAVADNLFDLKKDVPYCH